MILIIDFGSQYNQLIARRVREEQVYCRIEPPDVEPARVAAWKPEGIILSGGPASVYEKGSPKIAPEILAMGIPVLGICYGFQFLTLALGGEVIGARKREYGFAELEIKGDAALFQGVKERSSSWMSHGDTVGRLPSGFEITASTASTKVAAAEDRERGIYGVQFHPEVAHTEEGRRILENFLFSICRCRSSWTMGSFIEEATAEIHGQAGEAKVVLGLSGGVDSSVAALLLQRALGRRLTCIFVDNGLLRENEASKVRELFKRHFHVQVRFVSAAKRFLTALKGVTDPERKRKIIGRIFIEVFEEEARKIKGVEFLAQGTLYPDVIESRSPFGGPSAVIKSHHNVGGLPKRMALELIEPLKHLFKDEVRLLGRELGLPEELVKRQPFPGPGLAVRIVGEVTARKLKILRRADAIFLEEIRQNNLYRNLWQAFAVLLSLKSVGIMGDERTYDYVIALRAVESDDAMTADWARLPQELLARVSSRIINEVAGVNRVVYDISSKPPSTIEWE